MHMPYRLISPLIYLARVRVLAAAVAPVVKLHHPARDHRPLGLESVANRDQTQLVEPAEGGQVRGREGSVRHVEVFPMGWCENPHPRKTSTPTP